MARRRARTGRSTTFWHGVTFGGLLATSGETFPVISDTLMLEWGPVTLLRMKVLGFAQGVLAGDTASVFAMSFRKVTLDRAGDSPSDIGGTLMDGSYLSSEQILHYSVHRLDSGFQQDEGAYSQRPGTAINIDVKAKRRFGEENEQLVIDLEALGVGIADTINLQLAMRLLLMPH